MPDHREDTLIMSAGYGSTMGVPPKFMARLLNNRSRQTLDRTSHRQAFRQFIDGLHEKDCATIRRFLSNGLALRFRDRPDHLAQPHRKIRTCLSSSSSSTPAPFIG